MQSRPVRDRGAIYPRLPHDTRCAGRCSFARPAHAFTLIELVVVITIIGIVAGLVTTNLGTFSYWREEGAIRRLAETLAFLHRQAVVDQENYRLEFNFEENTYRVGAVREEDWIASSLAGAPSQDVGILSLELAAFLSPHYSSESSMIPPPSFPSLAEPVELPQGMYIEDVATVRGTKGRGDGDPPYVIFSKRGFTEFAVVHLRTSTGNPVTLRVNQFTGIPEIYREYREFVMTGGGNAGQAEN